ncbi:HAD family hydrolase [Candidatus Magnetaquicoccus inordinatus]|uniref:histidinol-phosphatase n=1 Tax=Candidatus Magnetaquicoccus inordinatus TaxID=2496818 RepID=UPI00102AEC3B|nr:HAD family hydrolase [Candidatus Magnetaquicoccus inordinatus]
MALALFDLDNTLLAGDSDHLWGEFLIEKGIVNEKEYRLQNDQFFLDYQQGTLDILAYLTFQAGILAQYQRPILDRWRSDYLQEKILPIIAPHTPALLQWHRQRGDTLIIITATNQFVTTPIAQHLGVHALLATGLEEIDGQFTGQPDGIPCFREGKVLHMMQWMKQTGTDLAESWFYSDSHNDLPLLGEVAYPVAVDPDEKLRQVAQEKEWPIISLRQPAP